MILLENDMGKYPVGMGHKTLEELKTPKYAIILKYIEDVSNRPSVKETYSKVGFQFRTEAQRRFAQ